MCGMWLPRDPRCLISRKPAATAATTTNAAATEAVVVVCSRMLYL